MRAGIPLALLLIAASGAAAEPAAGDTSPWRELLRRDGVTVSLRDRPEGGVPAFRGVTELAARPYEILAVLRDVSAHVDWMYRCTEAHLLRELGDHSAVIYNRTGFPWPVSDRDVVLQTRWEEVGGTVAMRFEATIDAAAGPVDGLVRMPRLEGAYLLEPLEAERTKVVYEVDLDPGGRLPAWLVSRYSRELPLQTLVGLRRRVGETRGRYDAWLDQFEPEGPVD